MEREHPEVFKKATTGTGPPEKNMKQQKITFVSNKLPPLPHARQESLTEAVSNAIVSTLSPLNFVENPEVKEMFKKFEPRYEVPCRTTLTRRIEARFLDAKELLKKEVRKKFVAITHDAWTSLNTENYDTVTASFINDDWHLQCKVLETMKVNGSHTAENIEETLMSVKNQWDITKCVGTTDNASNEVKAFKLLNWTRVSCMGHNINLVVNAGLKEASRVTAKVRSVVSLFHSSPLAMGFLREKQNLLLPKEIQGHKLITDCTTRWNSTLDMLDRYIEQVPALHAVAIDPNYKNKDLKGNLLNFDEQALAEAFITILKPLKTATVCLSGEKEPTLAFVLPSLKKISDMLEEQEGDAGTIVKMKKAMRDKLERRTTLAQISPDYFKLACLLDPRTRKLNFMDDEEKEATKAELTEMMNDLQNQDEDSNDDELMDMMDIDTGAAASGLTDHSDTWLGDILGADTPVVPVSISDELTKYLSEPQLQVNPLDWWKINQKFYPKISKIAKQVLAIPATSVPAERIFSLAGRTVTKARASLHPDHVNMLIFIKKNLL